MTRTLLALTVAAVLGLPAAASADTCLGEPCPYSSQTTIGESGNGVLRFPQAIAFSRGANPEVYVGDQSSHLVQVFSRSGKFLRQFGTPGTEPGELTAVSSITVEENGTVALTDGGTNRVLLYDPQGNLIRTVSGGFRFGAGGGNDAPAGGGIVWSPAWPRGKHPADEALYVADSGNDRIVKLRSNGTLLGEFIPPGQLAYPRGMGVRFNRLVIADDKHHRLAVFRTDGKFLTSIGLGLGAGPGQLHNPFGVAFDCCSRMYVADDLNHRVVHFGPMPEYRYKSRWGSYGQARGRLAYPRALAAVGGDVFVTNTGNDRIDAFDLNGSFLYSFGRSGRGSGQFNAPVGITADRSGVRAVADSINGRVQLLNPDGTVSSIWGSPNPGPKILSRPVDVTFDELGDGWVLDQKQARVHYFSRSTARPSFAFGSYGSGPGQMIAPSAIAQRSDGRVWIADSGNRRIVRFDRRGRFLNAFPTVGTPRGIALWSLSKGYVTTSNDRVEIYSAAGFRLGHFGSRGSGLGQLKDPAGITVDSGGSIWVADRGNHRIAHFSASGEALGTFGSHGTGAGAQFISPSDVSVDCRGVLSVTDTRNNVVRTFQLTTLPQYSVCAKAIPPPAKPPVLQYSKLAPPDGPLIRTRVLRRVALASRGVALRASCDTPCRLTATANLTERGTRKGKSIRLTTVRVTIPAGGSKVLRLFASGRDAAALRRALGTERKVVASVALTARASVGEPTSRNVRFTGTR